MRPRLFAWLAAPAAAALVGCAHAPPPNSPEELRLLQEEVRGLRAERERDRRKLRALEAQLAARSRKEPQAAPSASRHVPPKDLQVVRLAPKAAEQEPEEAEEEDSYAFIAVGGSKPQGRAPRAPRPLAPTPTGGPDAAPALPTVVDLLLPDVEAGQPRGDFEAGLEALEDGDPARALELLERFVRTSPRESRTDDAVLAQGDAWRALHKPGNALQAYERVVRDFPAGDVVPEALLRYGETCLELGRASAAQAAFQRLLQDHPTSVAATRAQVHLAAR